jgi:hypothetical protein
MRRNILCAHGIHNTTDFHTPVEFGDHLSRLKESKVASVLGARALAVLLCYHRKCIFNSNTCCDWPSLNKPRVFNEWQSRAGVHRVGASSVIRNCYITHTQHTQHTHTHTHTLTCVCVCVYVTHTHTQTHTNVSEWVSVCVCTVSYSVSKRLWGKLGVVPIGMLMRSLISSLSSWQRSKLPGPLIKMCDASQLIMPKISLTASAYVSTCQHFRSCTWSWAYWKTNT